jgi:hypothetical protein
LTLVVVTTSRRLATFAKVGIRPSLLRASLTLFLFIDSAKSAAIGYVHAIAKSLELSRSV